ncbi:MULTISPECIES: glycine zipper 2TM domain-containing protein [Paraburkholderia]|uniref:glycine zipper 2TM domain-containing protein n=1 Tax=Paraburkholderia TaxID=1822464 RepID=UPI002257C859|nr:MULTISPECIES: glycine zipper 2TM domain-containing protein [Paraburkholderia]MCX4174707.1 glycine zipper 2TM domain-containing protein [Paraburkholderia madseniana]MDQ6462708.1 glycine zipper 2TM domain-containing protein [Paraburkholderia madseniana]
MNTNLTSSNSQRSRIHPLVAGAAVAVILASATGIAAMTGLLPTSHAVTEPAQPATTVAAQVASAPVAAPQAAPVQQPVQQTVQQAAPARPRVHHTHSTPAAETPRYANNQGYQAPYEPAPARPVADPYAGEVVAINTVQAPEPTTGLGALGGAVAGGLVGNQIGGGRGKILTTIAGAVGGGLAGNGIEHAVRKQTTYQVQVRMQDGSYRNFSYPTQPDVQIGERVHVSGDSLTAS